MRRTQYLNRQKLTGRFCLDDATPTRRMSTVTSRHGKKTRQLCTLRHYLKNTQLSNKSTIPHIMPITCSWGCMSFAGASYEAFNDEANDRAKFAVVLRQSLGKQTSQSNGLDSGSWQFYWDSAHIACVGVLKSWDLQLSNEPLLDQIDQYLPTFPEGGTGAPKIDLVYETIAGHLLMYYIVTSDGLALPVFCERDSSLSKQVQQ